MADFTLIQVMTNEQQIKWAHIRAKGMARYVAVEGVLKAGGLFAYLTATVRYTLKHGFTLAHLAEYVFDEKFIYATAFNWLAFGVVMGVLGWNKQEREYAKASNSAP